MADDALVGAVLDGRYKIIGPIAQGGMGAVYKAERLKLGRVVAIKMLHGWLPADMTSLQRFEVEAMAMAQLEHPHCVQVFDVGVHGNNPYIVMELVRGKTLKELLADGTFSHGRAASIVKQILSGLGHAHELGIIHRDIKPANVIVSNKSGIGEHVRILDFGLVRWHASTGLTDGLAVGTPAYMAPEQCSGQPISARTDIYAVGVVLFELLVGRRPFEHADPLQMVRMHLSERAPRLDAIRAENFGVLETIVARALAKDPAERYEDAAAMSRALDAVRQSSSDLVVDKSIPLDADDIVESTPIQYPATLPGFPVTKASAPTGVPAIPEPPVVAKASAPAGVPAIPESAIATQVLELTPAPAKLEPAANPDEPRFLVTMPVIEPPAPAERSGVVADPSVVIPASSSGRRVVVVIFLLGVIAAGLGLALSQGWLSPAPRPPADAPRATHATPADPVPKIAAKAAELASSGRAELALEQLNAGRLAHPASALLAYRAGRLHAERGSWREAFTAFRDAIRLDAKYRNDADLIRDVLRGFIIASDFAPHAAFLHDDIGVAAKPFLDETARTHHSPKIRARAAAELARFR